MLALLTASLPSARAEQPTDFDRVVKPLLAKHCVSCHGPVRNKGGLNVESLTGEFSKEGYTWTQIHNVVGSGIMPPPGRDPISDDDRKRLLAWIVAQSKAFPLRTAARRLNREEFTNTLNDLLGLREDFAAKLPEDVSVNGFDTNAGALTMTSEAFEQYLEAIVTAVGWRFDASTPGFEPVVVAVEPPPKTKTPSKAPRPRVKLSTQNSATSPSFPKENTVGLRPRVLGFSGGGTNPAHLEFDFPTEFCETLPEAVDRFKLTLRVRSAAPPSGSLPRLIVEVNRKKVLDQPLEPRADFQDVVCYFRKSELTRQDGFTIHVMNGYETADFLEEFPKAREALGREKGKLKEEYTKGLLELLDQLPVIFVEKIVLEPARYSEDPVPAHGLALTRLAELPGDARRNALETFLSHVYRRPLTAEEQKQFAGLFDKEFARTKSAQKAVESCLMFALGSPKFLYVGAKDPATSPNDHHLAERLSYFLWSTTPDRTLDGLARAGKLRTGRTLEEQVHRMLDHPNAERFFDRFARQWLETEKLEERHESTDATYRTPQQAYLRSSLRREGGAFLKELVRSNRSALSIIDSDFLLVNDRTSTHYGLPMVRGGEFRVVSLPKDSPYGGVTALASVMTTTDHGMFRPIYRGAWVQKNLFNRQLPPPPSDVPELDPNDPRYKNKSLKQQLALHQEHPKCAVCHKSMDPLGYAFQEFDALGRFGNRGKGPVRGKIESDGAFPNGERYAGVAEFRTILLEKYRDDVIRGFISKLITYGRGREPSLGEREWIDRLVDLAKRNEYRMRPMLLSIVTSPEFLH